MSLLLKRSMTVGHWNQLHSADETTLPHIADLEDSALTFSFLLALNFLSCSTVSGRWILYAYLSLSCRSKTNRSEDMNTLINKAKQI